MTSFRSLREASAEDWATIARLEEADLQNRNAGEGLLRLLALQEGDHRSGWPINIYRHCLQSATRAYRAGESEELIFCALFHDAAEIISPLNHSGAIADLLGPYVSDDHRWMLEHHPEFQSGFAVNHPFRDSSSWEKYRGHPAFELTYRFCERYDQNCFDRDYDIMPLEAFAPLVDRICRRKQPRAGGDA
jgi:predicted HD phosphohydrolase